MRDVQMSDIKLSAWIDTHLFPNGHDFPPAPYTLSRESCALMEAEIARRGLIIKYLGCLCDVTGANFELYAYNTAFEANLWLIATATPRQRCEAAYVALGVQQQARTAT